MNTYSFRCCFTIGVDILNAAAVADKHARKQSAIVVELGNSSPQHQPGPQA